MLSIHDICVILVPLTHEHVVIEPKTVIRVPEIEVG